MLGEHGEVTFGEVCGNEMWKPQKLMPYSTNFKLVAFVWPSEQLVKLPRRNLGNVVLLEGRELTFWGMSEI